MATGMSTFLPPGHHPFPLPHPPLFPPVPWPLARMILRGWTVGGEKGEEEEKRRRG